MSEDKTGKTSQEDAARNGAPDQAPPPEAGPENTETGEAGGWARGELESLREENAALKDRLLRSAAEMENLRRRTERDKADTAKYAISNFAREVLAIGDNIARAIAHVPKDAADNKNAILEVRAGTGGDEAQDFQFGVGPCAIRCEDGESVHHRLAESGVVFGCDDRRGQDTADGLVQCNGPARQRRDLRGDSFMCLVE